MDIGVIPIADTIPVHRLWFEVLLFVTFLLHIIAMNLILGGGLIASYKSLKGLAGKEYTNLPTLVALTVNFGVPPLLFLQVIYGNLFYTSSVIMASYWLMVIPFIILAYYLAYIFVYRREVSPRVSKFAMISATFLLLLIAFLFVNNITLSIVPQAWSVYLTNDSGWYLNLTEPTLYPRYLHMVTGAVAVAALGSAVYHKIKKTGVEKEREYLKIFSYVTLINIIFGLWFLIAIPDEILPLFMGQNILYTGIFVVGFVMGIVTLLFSFTGKVYQTVGFLVGTLVVMLLHREMLRSAYLGEIFDPASLQVTGEFSPLIMFLVTFIIGLYSIYYMLKISFINKR